MKFKISLSDGTNTIEIETRRIEWLTGSDNEVQFYSIVTIDIGKQLDSWEENGTQLTVNIEPVKCDHRYPDGYVESECTDEENDYLSQSGKATLQWTYNPSGESVITLQFSEIE